MLNARGLVVAGMGGMLGAVLVAVLVLGGDGRVEALSRESLDDEGGVMWMWVDSYERAPFGNEASPRHERTLRETWTRFAPGEGAVTIFASHTIEGELLARSRLVRGNVEDSWSGLGELRKWPRPRGHSIGLGGDVSCERHAPELAPAGGLCVGPHARPETDSPLSAGMPAWPIDLDVVSAQREVRLHPDGGPLSETFRALLADGSRVVIASQRYHFTVLPLSEWDSIEALVFGNEARR